ncbi:type IX secretion system protein PorQ [Wenyingzhuangia sp. IMCC45533]
MRYIVSILFVFIFKSMYSQVGGETLYPFLNLPTSPKQIALGGVTLTSRNDVSQAIWNPAIVNNEIDGDVSINYVNYIADIKVGSLSYVRSINPKYGIASFGVQFFDYGDLERTNASGPTVVGSFGARDLAIALGYGYTYKDVTLGVSLKYVSSKIDTFTSSAILYDIGAVYVHPYYPLVMALVIRNNGKQLTQFTNREEAVSNNVIVSAEYQLEHVPLKLYASFDELNNWDISVPNPSQEKTDLEGEVTPEKISTTANILRHMSGGVELWPDKKLNIRIGYNHRRAQEFRLNDVRTGSGLSYGFGFNTKRIKFDYAFSKFQEGAKYSTFGLTLHLQ